jgi:hypothetical protein
MEKMSKSTGIAIGVLGAVVGVTGSILIFNAVTNNASSSGWVIPQDAFGDYEMEPSYLTNAELYGYEVLPDFVEDLNWQDYVNYQGGYVVVYDVDETLNYNGQTEDYHETYFSIFSSTGVNLWTYHFDITEAYAIGTFFYNREDPIEVEHMALEGDSVIFIMEIVNRFTFFDPITELDITVDNGNGFDLIGGDSEGENVAQSFVRLDLEEKTFHVLGVSEAEKTIFDSENFERIEPLRYALAQEFDNEYDEAFSYDYYGETLTFGEQTDAIALLSEVTFHPTLFTMTFETIGEWSSTEYVDIDLYELDNTKQEELAIIDSGLMILNVTIGLEDSRIDAANNVMTADDDLLTTAQQTLIDNASVRYTDDDQIENLEYQIYGVLDKNFNKVTLDILESVETTVPTFIEAYVWIYWVRGNDFVMITNEQEYNNDGTLVKGLITIRFQTGTTVTKTLDLSSYGEVVLREFFMDDEGKMIIAGEFGSSETNPIQTYQRSFVLIMNDDGQILDDFIIDGEGTSSYIDALYVDDNQIRIYLYIQDIANFFADMDPESNDVLITLELI